MADFWCLYAGGTEGWPSRYFSTACAMIASELFPPKLHSKWTGGLLCNPYQARGPCKLRVRELVDCAEFFYVHGGANKFLVKRFCSNYCHPICDPSASNL